MLNNWSFPDIFPTFAICIKLINCYFMGQILTKFDDGSYLEYDWGGFDKWCVYLKRPNEVRYPPKDVDYFSRLKKYAETHGAQKVYDDFVSIYNKTTKEVSDAVFADIKELAKGYGADETDLAIDFSIMYMGMIAEENKARTMLGKRIKRLGVHQVLIEGMDYSEAANYSRGMGWRFIDKECKTRGF